MTRRMAIPSLRTPSVGAWLRLLPHFRWYGASSNTSQAVPGRRAWRDRRWYNCRRNGAIIGGYLRAHVKNNTASMWAYNHASWRKPTCSDRKIHDREKNGTSVIHEALPIAHKISDVREWKNLSEKRQSVFASHFPPIRCCGTNVPTLLSQGTKVCGKLY